MQQISIDFKTHQLVINNELLLKDLLLRRYTLFAKKIVIEIMKQILTMDEINRKQRLILDKILYL